MSDTIINKKNQLTNLVQGIVDDYTSMNDVQIKKNCEMDLELSKMSDIIKEQERHSKEMTQEHIDKELKIQKLKKQLYEYEELIKKLEDKVVLLNDTKVEENKFNIVRIQAKDIEDKDREIDRLNKQIVYFKESKKGKVDRKTIDIVLDKIDTVKEIKVKEIKVEEEAVDEEAVVKEESVDEAVVKEEAEESVEEEAEESVEEECELIKFTYRNKMYCYQDGEGNIAYHYRIDGTKGDIAGKWGQTKTGKIKLLKK